MRKREMEAAWGKMSQDLGTAETMVAELRLSIASLRDLNQALEEQNDELHAELRIVRDALKKAEDAAWLAEAKQNVYVEAAALKPFHAAPLSCPYCGGEDISTTYRGRCDPLAEDGDRYKGHPAYMLHFCRSCGAPLGETKTLEASCG